MSKRMISINGACLSYELRQSRRARRVRVSVACDGMVSLTLPWFVPVAVGERFLSGKAEWVSRKIVEMAGRKVSPLAGFGKREYRKRRDEALAFVVARIEHWNRFYGFRYGRVSVRNQKSRWGSCSTKGNLSFNWKLLLLPPELSDYVIVHELCHLAEHNHSEAFWVQVARTIPDHRDIRRALKGM